MSPASTGFLIVREHHFLHGELAENKMNKQIKTKRQTEANRQTNRYPG